MARPRSQAGVPSEPCRILKKRGNIRHHVPTVVFVVLMALALAQSLWWVVYQLTESARARDLELQILEERSRFAERELQGRGRPLDRTEQENFLRAYPGLALMDADSAITGLSPVVASASIQAAWRASDRRARMFLVEGGFFMLLLLLALRFQLSAQQGLREAVRQQSNFISAVTHELKSPLTSIRLYAELLENPDIKPEARLRGATVIREEADRLSALVEQILRARALDAREMRLELRPLELRAWLDERIPALEGRLVAHDRKLDPRASGGAAELWVVADEEALDLVLGNLVDNAIKYSSKGSRVWLELEGKSGWSELRVRDEGVGFEREESRRLFDRFYRGGSELTRRTKGTGLGLYLVREFVEAMQGRVLAESDGPGRGATFTVMLPIRQEGKV